MIFIIFPNESILFVSDFRVVVNSRIISIFVSLYIVLYSRHQVFDPSEHPLIYMQSCYGQSISHHTCIYNSNHKTCYNNLNNKNNKVEISLKKIIDIYIPIIFFKEILQLLFFLKSRRI